jgi:hypothetical protein
MRWHYKQELRRETALERDLGITGDDAVEFIEAFSDEFNVDVADLRLSDYFDGEGFGLIPFHLLFSKKDRNPNPRRQMTLGDLERAVLLGRWSL